MDDGVAENRRGRQRSGKFTGGCEKSGKSEIFSKPSNRLTEVRPLWYDKNTLSCYLIIALNY